MLYIYIPYWPLVTEAQTMHDVALLESSTTIGNPIGRWYRTVGRYAVLYIDKY